MKVKTVFFGWAIFLVAFQVSFAETASTTSMAATKTIEGPEWQLKELSGIPVPTVIGERKPFLMLDAAKKQATGFTGCNNFFSGYQLDGTALTFGPVGSTRKACPDLHLSMETGYFTALEKTNNWQLQDNALLLLDDSKVLVRFTKKHIQGITDTVWQWAQTLYSDDRKVVPTNPRVYTLHLGEDRTISVKADCNMKGGSYSIQDNHLSFAITHSTIAACPEDSLETEFTRGLSEAASYFIEDGDLYLDLKFDSGTIRFSRQD